MGFALWADTVGLGIVSVWAFSCSDICVFWGSGPFLRQLGVFELLTMDRILDGAKVWLMPLREFGPENEA